MEVRKLSINYPDCRVSTRNDSGFLRAGFEYKEYSFSVEMILVVINIKSTMRILILLVLVALAFSFKMDYDCPHTQEVTCIDDINKAFPICEKAAHEKGADVPIDLECMKWFATVGEDCWNCICWIAQTQKVPVFGC